LALDISTFSQAAWKPCVSVEPASFKDDAKPSCFFWRRLRTSSNLHFSSISPASSTASFFSLLA
jgi:hypothetical protein